MLYQYRDRHKSRILSLFNAGLDIMIFVAVALYAKDRNMVDAALKDFFESSGMMETGYWEHAMK